MITIATVSSIAIVRYIRSIHIMEEILGIAQHYILTTIQIIDKNHRYIIYKIDFWRESLFCGEVVYFGGEVMALGRGVDLYSGEVRRRITGKCGQFCGEVDVFLGEA